MKTTIASVAAVACFVQGSTSLKNDLKLNFKSAIDERIAHLKNNNNSPQRQLSNTARPNFSLLHRRFQATETTSLTQEAPSSQESCDASFLKCLPHEKCLGCFSNMQSDGIDWASVKPETPCTDVLNFLNTNGKCKNLEGDQDEIDVFCNTFNNCVVWDDGMDDDDAMDISNGEEFVDCEKLTACKWEGMHEGFVGDGTCHDKIPGCYNHKICNYDGGDCCEDTCKSSSYATCGGDGFTCRDPGSTKCNRFLTDVCNTTKAEEKAATKKPECKPEETIYRLVQYDSFGDGWDKTKMVLTLKDQTDVIYSGGLETGPEGTDFVCLSTKPTCYSVFLKGGVWGKEITWEVRPMSEGSMAVAFGGAPMECDFPLNGAVCEKTCNGVPEEKDISGNDYQSYADLLECVETKCIIQIGGCELDESCKPCLVEDAPSYCYANANYNALLDCAICTCTDSEETKKYCAEKAAAGKPQKEAVKKDEKGEVGVCNADQTLKGSQAVMDFSECSSVGSTAAMVTNFDQNNFGVLDTFEACAHTFAKEELHGGKKALDCMRMLSNAAKDAPGDDDGGDGAGEDDESDAVGPPKKAIAALAKNLYKNADQFCTCASKASDTCPLCQSFLHFKTLLYETLDACQALDEIDCDSWTEFHDRCKPKIVEKYGKVDFDNSDQCDFIQNGCGDELPFPAFRRLDCGHEISKASWDMYNLFQRGCLKESGGETVPPPTVTPPTPTPKPPTTSYSPPPPTAQPPTQTPPYGPTIPTSPTSGSSTQQKKPYIPPPDDRPSQPYSSPTSPYRPPEEKKKKSHHRFLTFLVFVTICGGGYYYYKHRPDAFEFVRYRRQRNYGGESEMYSGLAMDSGASSFEPPSLPPTPSSLA